MKTNYLLSLLILFSSNALFAQYTSIRHEESVKYGAMGNLTMAQWDASRGKQAHVAVEKSNCNLEYEVYGWDPYWSGSAYTSYDFSLISTYVYFAMEVNPSTGGYNTVHDWATTPAVDMARNAGCKVDLCVTNFGKTNNHTLLQSSSRRSTLIDNIVTQLNVRAADGVNIDFEAVDGADKSDLTNFFQELRAKLNAVRPNTTVSVALPAVDWEDVWDIQNLKPVVDKFVIMGYDYYWGASTSAGPTGILYQGGGMTDRTQARSVAYYLNEGIAKKKLLLGVPYYGRNWKTASANVPSNTTANGSVVRFFELKNNASGAYTNSNRTLHNPSKSSYWTYVFSGERRQCWIDDEEAMGYKYDFVKQTDIGGIGIWALGYDAGRTELWDLLKNKFTDCATDACSGEVYDMGGPGAEYFSDQDYTFSLSADVGATLTVVFSQFDLEYSYDSLWVYDGTSTSSPLVGGYTGGTIPPTIVSTGNTLTFRFMSDSTTVKDGFKFTYYCSNGSVGSGPDIVAPGTKVVLSNNWQTTNFPVNFQDTDPAVGQNSGVFERFYNVIENNGTNWSANTENEFAHDKFDVLSANWTALTGTWSVAGGKLLQTDNTLLKTHISMPLKQGTNDKYLYHWKALFYGGGTNERMGIQFFASDPVGTSASPTDPASADYLVYFREGSDHIEIYENKPGQSISTVVTVPYSFSQNVVYDFKVMYDKSTGRIMVYVDNELSAMWTDPNPLQTGDYVLFRTGDAKVEVDDFNMYISRSTSANVSVGSASTNDIRYQNMNPTSPSGKIQSIVLDNSHNFSVVTEEPVNVDWTAPDVFAITDVFANTNTKLGALWNPSMDIHSDIMTYEYAVGSSVGATDYLNWTDVGNIQMYLGQGLNLQLQQTYHVSVKAINNAGLSTIVHSSMLFTSVNELLDKVESIGPNPFVSTIDLTFNSTNSTKVQLQLFDAKGSLVKDFGQYTTQKELIRLSVSDLNPGLYFLSIQDLSSNERQSFSLIKQ